MCFVLRKSVSNLLCPRSRRLLSGGCYPCAVHEGLCSTAASPGNDLEEINKYVNVYFLLNLKAASIKIFDF